MYEHSGFHKKNLELQLESFKMVLEANTYLLENDQHLSDQINHWLGILESDFDELDKEEENDQIQDNPSLEEADKILEEIKFLIQRMLN